MPSSFKNDQKSPNRSITYLAMSISLVFSSTALYAADSLDEVTNTLPTLSVQAQGNWLENASVEKVQQHAGARTIIDRKRLDGVAATTIKDALKQVPGVQVQDNAGTAGSDLSLSFGVRGLSSRFSPRSTVLIDGVPLAFAPYGQPQLSLAPTSLGNIDSIDVIRGAGSVRFGPQNVGGIINFNTRAIPEQTQASIGLNTEFSKNGNIKLFPNLFVGGTLDNGLGLALLYSGTQGDGYRDDNDHNNINDIMLKTNYKLTDQDKIEANIHRYDAKSDMPGGLTTAEFNQNSNQSTRDYDYFKGHRTDASVKYSHTDDINTYEVLAYHTDTFRDAVMEKTNDNNANQSQLRTAPRNYKVTAFEPRFSHLYQAGSTQNEVSVGYRYLVEESEEYIGRSAWYTKGSAPLSVGGYSSAEGKTTAHSIYIDNRTDLGAWSITPGVRFESIKTKENFYKLNTNNSINNSVNTHIKSNEALPNLSILYKFNDSLNVFANYGISFGPQQYSQMAKIDGSQAVSQTDGLSPEKAKNYEVGMHYLSDALSAELTAFYIDFDQELLRVNNGGQESWTNLGATKHQGIEAGLRYDFGSMSDALAGLTVYSNLTYTDATAAAGARKGEDLSFYSNWVSNLGVAYTLNHWTLNSDIFAQSKQIAPNSNGSVNEVASGMYGRIPGYALVSLKAQYDFAETLQGLKVGVGIKNLFDQRYFTRSSDANGGKFAGQPRTLLLQTSFDF